LVWCSHPVRPGADDAQRNARHTSRQRIPTFGGHGASDRGAGPHRAEPPVGTTRIVDSNKVLEIGRRFGLGGRLYNQAIFVSENLLLKGDTVAGWVVVPQEGNTILSTISAFLERTRPGSQPVMDELVARLLIRDL